MWWPWVTPPARSGPSKRPPELWKRRLIAVIDPEALHPTGGEVADPPVRDHSGYPEAADFTRGRWWPGCCAGPCRHPGRGSASRTTRSAWSAVPATSRAFASSLPSAQARACSGVFPYAS